MVIKWLLCVIIIINVILYYTAVCNISNWVLALVSQHKDVATIATGVVRWNHKRWSQGLTHAGWGECSEFHAMLWHCWPTDREGIQPLITCSNYAMKKFFLGGGRGLCTEEERRSLRDGVCVYVINQSIRYEHSAAGNRCRQRRTEAGLVVHWSPVTQTDCHTASQQTDYDKDHALSETPRQLEQDLEWLAHEWNYCQ